MAIIILTFAGGVAIGCGVVPSAEKYMQKLKSYQLILRVCSCNFINRASIL